MKDNKKQKQKKEKNLDQYIDRVEQLEEELRKLALTIDTVEDEKLEIQNQLKKALADYQNLERGINERVENRLAIERRGVGEVLITMNDDISVGLEESKKLKLDDESKAWLEGVTMILGKMQGALGKLEIKQIDVKKGETFDSELHEALGVVEEGKDGTVFDVIQPGYMMGDKVVRAARVIVTKLSK